MARKNKYIISLADNEVNRLKSLIRKKSTTRTIKCRCQILLALDESHGKQYTQEQCAKSIGVCKATVYNVIKYYVVGGIDNVLSVNRSVNSTMPVANLMEEQRLNLLKLLVAQRLKVMQGGHFVFWKNVRESNLTCPLAKIQSAEL